MPGATAPLSADQAQVIGQAISPAVAQAIGQAVTGLLVPTDWSVFAHVQALAPGGVVHIEKAGPMVAVEALGDLTAASRCTCRAALVSCGAIQVPRGTYHFDLDLLPGFLERLRAAQVPFLFQYSQGGWRKSVLYRPQAPAVPQGPPPADLTPAAPRLVAAPRPRRLQTAHLPRRRS